MFRLAAFALATIAIGTVQGKDSSLTPCIDLAIQELKADGTLQAITEKWLSKKTGKKYKGLPSALAKALLPPNGHIPTATAR